MASFFLGHALLLYILLLGGMLIEGEMILLTAIFLAYQGYLNFWLVLITAFVGMFIGDILWFKFGRYLESFSFLKKWVFNFAQPMDEQLNSQPLRSLIIAKFAYGLHRAILLRAGALVKIKKFLQMDFIAILVWFSVIGVLGYFFSASLSLLERRLKFTEILLLVAVAAFFAVSYIISKFSKKRF